MEQQAKPSTEQVSSRMTDALVEFGADANRFHPDATLQELDIDSLDLYELVMELEDGYGIRVPEEDAAQIKTVGDAIDFVVEHAPV